MFLLVFDWDKTGLRRFAGYSPPTISTPGCIRDVALVPNQDVLTKNVVQPDTCKRTHRSSDFSDAAVFSPRSGMSEACIGRLAE